MTNSIKSIFEEYAGSIKIDRRLVKLLNDTRLDFVHRNEDHLQFFSGNLLGVYPVRYRNTDRDLWFDDILGIEERDIKEAVRKLPTIDDDWVRANDAVNLSSIWLIYRLHHAQLSSKDKEQAMTDVCLLLQYKFISSIMAHYFPYPADKAVALATYEALSLKFELKQLGSWQALLEHRTKAILDKRGIHYKVYNTLDSDAGVINMISDIQDRLREIVKKIRAVFEKVKTQNLRITSVSSVITLDGEKEILDRSRDYTTYLRYLKNIIGDKQTFIRKELIDVVHDAIPTARREYLVQALNYCSEQYGVKGDPKIELLMDECLIHTFSHIAKKTGVMNSPANLSNLIIELKNLYMASRMQDETLIKMRENAESIVVKSVRTKNKAAQNATRTALQVYLVIRAFARNYYQGG